MAINNSNNLDLAERAIIRIQQPRYRNNNNNNGSGSGSGGSGSNSNSSSINIIVLKRSQPIYNLKQVAYVLNNMLRALSPFPSSSFSTFSSSSSSSAAAASASASSPPFFSIYFLLKHVDTSKYYTSFNEKYQLLKQSMKYYQHPHHHHHSNKYIAEIASNIDALDDMLQRLSTPLRIALVRKKDISELLLSSSYSPSSSSHYYFDLLALANSPTPLLLQKNKKGVGGGSKYYPYYRSHSSSRGSSRSRRSSNKDLDLDLDLDLQEVIDYIDIPNSLYLASIVITYYSPPLTPILTRDMIMKHMHIAFDIHKSFTCPSSKYNDEFMSILDTFLSKGGMPFLSPSFLASFARKRRYPILLDTLTLQHVLINAALLQFDIDITTTSTTTTTYTGEVADEEVIKDEEEGEDLTFLR
ncbi:MAG: hypothetical protein QXI43_00130 [Candidatus Nitrosocaldus sp.]